jgi:hypothetical protein
MFLNVAKLLSLLDNLFTEYLYIYYLSSIQQESEKKHISLLFSFLFIDGCGNQN